ncbi:unnamed protein product, partial [Mesorhabditis spiculigera]
MGAEARRAATAKKKGNPPILSHDFIIQNHGDIMSCILMLVVVGFMFPTTAPLSSIFVVPQYNETVAVNVHNVQFDAQIYKSGVRDVFTVLFYTIGWITMHAIIQEYIIDKLQRKVHLSKSKLYKFGESGHHIFFAIYSIAHAGYIIHEFFTSHNDFKNLWAGYPEDHAKMNLSTKLFFILQLSYWVHHFPEFYFAKMKKDEMQHRAFLSFIHIGFIAGAYIMNFQRVAVVLLAIQYLSDVVFHIARLAHFLDKRSVAKSAFKAWNITFFVARAASAAVAGATFWYGLRQSGVPNVDLATGNFNTSFIRLNSLIAVLALQLFMLYQFVVFHFGRLRDARNRKKGGEQKKQAPVKRSDKRTDSESSAQESAAVTPEQKSPGKRKQKAQASQQRLNLRIGERRLANIDNEVRIEIYRPDDYRFLFADGITRNTFTQLRERCNISTDFDNFARNIVELIKDRETATPPLQINCVLDAATDSCSLELVSKLTLQTSKISIGLKRVVSEELNNHLIEALHKMKELTEKNQQLESEYRLELEEKEVANNAIEDLRQDLNDRDDHVEADARWDPNNDRVRVKELTAEVATKEQTIKELREKEAGMIVEREKLEAELKARQKELEDFQAKQHYSKQMMDKFQANRLAHPSPFGNPAIGASPVSFRPAMVPALRPPPTGVLGPLLSTQRNFTATQLGTPLRNSPQQQLLAKYTEPAPKEK